MKRFALLTTCAAFLASCPTFGDVLQIAGRKQLFIDRTFIEHAHGVSLHMNAPIKSGPVLQGTRSWENGLLTSAATIIEDGGKYRIWYTACPASGPSLPPFRLCYAESTDGIHWQKPNLGIYEWEGSTANNIIMDSNIENGGGILIDPKGRPDQRYKLLARLSAKSVVGHGRDPQVANAPNGSGMYLYTSPDGIKWTLQPTRVFPFSPDTVNMAIYDPATDRYLSYVRTWIGDRRRVGVVETTDLLKPWPYDKTVAPRKMGNHLFANTIPVPSREIPEAFGSDQTDLPSVDHYTSAVVRYPWADRAFFMFPSAYRHFPEPPASKFRNDGPLDIQMAVSRTGRSFQRISRFPYIELGLTGSLDSGSMYMCIGMLRRGSEIYQYYGAYDHTHGGYVGLPEIRNSGSILLVRQRLDGFVSVDADESGGEFVTPVLSFEGKQLTLNLDASATGEVLVELRDGAGKALPAYTFAESDILGQNAVDAVATWRRGQADVSALAGKPVRIAFKLRTAKLYAFQFTE